MLINLSTFNTLKNIYFSLLVLFMVLDWLWLEVIKKNRERKVLKMDNVTVSNKEVLKSYQASYKEANPDNRRLSTYNKIELEKLEKQAREKFKKG